MIISRSRRSIAASVPAMARIEGEIRTDEELDAEREARRRLALAQIRQYPDPVLRMKANPVEEFDDELHRLVDRMRALMIDANGVGLAATQVRCRFRCFSRLGSRVMSVYTDITWMPWWLRRTGS